MDSLDSIQTNLKKKRPTPYGKAALEEESIKLKNAPEGKRNDTLNRSAHALGQLIAGEELDEDEVRQGLRVAARQTGLPDDEIYKTLRSGLDAGKKHPRSVTCKEEIDQIIKECEESAIEGPELDRRLLSIFKTMSIMGPAERAQTRKRLKKSFGINTKDIDEAIKKVKMNQNIKTKTAAEIIEEESEEYYQFAFTNKDGLYSNRNKNFISKSTFREPFNQEVLNHLASSDEALNSSLSPHQIPTLYRNFSTVAFNQLEDKLPKEAPVPGFSIVNGKMYISGANGVWEYKNNNLVLTKTRPINTNDKFIVMPDLAYKTCQKPIPTFNRLFRAVGNFKFSYDIDATIFTLYLMYLANWELWGQRLHCIMSGPTQSGKTALSSLISEVKGDIEGDPAFRDFSLIPNSLRARADSTIAGLQKALRQHPHSCLVLDEAELNDEGYMRVTRIINSLRAASGGGEPKYRGGQWKCDTQYPPTIISGIHLNLDETDRSRFLVINLQLPDEEAEPVTKILHAIRNRRDSQITQLITCLLPCSEQIKKYIHHNYSNNRTENFFLPLLAIAKVVFSDTPEVFKKVKRRIETFESDTRMHIRDDTQFRQKLREIINVRYQITFNGGGNEYTTLVNEAQKVDTGKWNKAGLMEAYIRLDLDSLTNEECPSIAFKEPLTFLQQIKYNPRWVSSFKSNQAFKTQIEKMNLGKRDAIKVNGKTLRVIVLDKSLY